MSSCSRDQMVKMALKPSQSRSQNPQENERFWWRMEMREILTDDVFSLSKQKIIFENGISIEQLMNDRIKETKWFVDTFDL